LITHIHGVLSADVRALQSGSRPHRSTGSETAAS
jgi:hypothetical protein